MKIQDTKYIRKYGMKILELSDKIGVSPGTIIRWEKRGFDIFYRAKQLNSIKGNKTLQQLWSNLQWRCGNPKDKKYKYYGGKGIKVEMLKSDLLYLWNRDDAEKMKQPSLDRIDSSKNYSLKNCRFIEMEENRMNRWKNKTLDK